jgi:hypothetical protein
MKINCFVSTGQKRVLHTLWIQSIGPNFCVYQYIKNLPADETKDITIAKEFCKQGRYDFIGLIDSPCYKKAIHIDAFGIQFKHKRKNGKEYYYGEPTEEFWKEWRENKEQLKANGFWVSKYVVPERYGNSNLIDTWLVFYRPKIEVKN